MEFIRNLRNNKKIKHNFIQQKHVSKKEHSEYMRKNKKNYFVCYYKNKPVGYVGVVKGDIRIAVVPKYSNQGIGKFMLNFIIEKYPKSVAKIKIENAPSLRLFESVGFRKILYLLKREDHELS